LNATKKGIVDTEALIERYRGEIEDLKRKLGKRRRKLPLGLEGYPPARRAQLFVSRSHLIASVVV